MKNREMWRLALAALLLVVGGILEGRADEFAIRSFNGNGRLAYNTLNNGTNYNYRVEWAPTPGGPWSTFGGAGAFWLDDRSQTANVTVTNMVPMCYRVVATMGDYMAVDLGSGPDADSYPVAYYSTLADVPDSGTSDTYKTTTLLMRLIPKGVYVMGTPSGELGYEASREETQHSVTLTKDFYIGVFEVTQRQWELVMGNRPSYFNNSTYYWTRPVEKVSYYDIRENPENSPINPNWPSSSQVYATSFMGKLRAKTGLNTFDLPTESQWEYACRAGTTTALNSGKNLTTQWSQCPNMAEVGRYYYNGGSGISQDSTTANGTAKVGSYLPNTWGLYDMHGNVWELCLDWYNTYPGTITDPSGASSESTRVIRGGGFNYFAPECRSATRNTLLTTSLRDYSIGFRAARTLP